MPQQQQTNQKEEGWTPDAPDGEESVAEDERSLDIGESGQFAPGGYYNQHGALKPDRLNHLEVED